MPSLLTKNINDAFKQVVNLFLLRLNITIGNTQNLQTEDKSNIVNAINEVNTLVTPLTDKQNYLEAYEPFEEPCVLMGYKAPSGENVIEWVRLSEFRSALGISTGVAPDYGFRIESNFIDFTEYSPYITVTDNVQEQAVSTKSGWDNNEILKRYLTINKIEPNSIDFRPIQSALNFDLTIQIHDVTSEIFDANTYSPLHDPTALLPLIVITKWLPEEKIYQIRVMHSTNQFADYGNEMPTLKQIDDYEGYIIGDKTEAFIAPVNHNYNVEPYGFVIDRDPSIVGDWNVAVTVPSLQTTYNQDYTLDIEQITYITDNFTIRKQDNLLYLTPKTQDLSILMSLQLPPDYRYKVYGSYLPNEDKTHEYFVDTLVQPDPEFPTNIYIDYVFNHPIPVWISDLIEPTS